MFEATSVASNIYWQMWELSEVLWKKKQQHKSTVYLPKIIKVTSVVPSSEQEVIVWNIFIYTQLWIGVLTQKGEKYIRMELVYRLFVTRAAIRWTLCTCTHAGSKRPSSGVERLLGWLIACWSLGHSSCAVSAFCSKAIVRSQMSDAACAASR